MVRLQSFSESVQASICPSVGHRRSGSQLARSAGHARGGRAGSDPGGSSVGSGEGGDVSNLGADVPGRDNPPWNEGEPYLWHGNHAPMTSLSPGARKSIRGVFRNEKGSSDGTT